MLTHTVHNQNTLQNWFYLTQGNQYLLLNDGILLYSECYNPGFQPSKSCSSMELLSTYIHVPYRITTIFIHNSLLQMNWKHRQCSGRIMWWLWQLGELQNLCNRLRNCWCKFQLICSYLGCCNHHIWLLGLQQTPVVTGGTQWSPVVSGSLQVVSISLNLSLVCYISLLVWTFFCWSLVVSTSFYWYPVQSLYQSLGVTVFCHHQ